MTSAPVRERVDGRVVRGRRTREAILDAAIDLLRLVGAGSVTHRAVAARAGTSLAATTYHFGTLDDLLVAAFELLTQRTVAQVEVYADGVLRGERDLVDAAVEFAETVDPGDGFGADGLVELTHAAIHHDRLHAQVEHYVEQMSAPFAELIGLDPARTLVRCLTGILVHHRAGSPALRADLTCLFDTFGLTAAVAHRLEEELT